VPYGLLRSDGHRREEETSFRHLLSVAFIGESSVLVPAGGSILLQELPDLSDHDAPPFASVVVVDHLLICSGKWYQKA